MLTPIFLLSLGLAIPAVLAGPDACKAPSDYTVPTVVETPTATPEDQDDYYVQRTLFHYSKVEPNGIPGEYIGNLPKLLSGMESLVRALAPNTKQCGEPSSIFTCRTAKQAVFPILASFFRYNITTATEKAALLSTIIIESDELQYDVSQENPTIGQGTRNMQMPEFNKEYAASLIQTRRDQLETHQRLYGWANDDNMGVDLNVDIMSPMEILDFLNSEDEYSFGSAAWYMTHHCDAETLNNLRTQRTDHIGFFDYLSKCLHIDMDEETPIFKKRLEIYDRALEMIEFWEL
ncbi:hypothetical protein KEM54_001388 [Ascosphaera aggregata]|nr:hypothetical protein KEM54_001388 [Ascosphaera aggregata]